MPVVVFFCSVIAILYHFGIMQAIIRTIGRVLAFGLGTTPAESLNVAGNMFIGQVRLQCFMCVCVCVCVCVLLLYVPSQQLWSLRDGQFT